MNVKSIPIQNILVTRLRFMGDIILTTPLLLALRQAFPKAHIGYLAETPYHQLLQPHPWVDSVFCLDRNKGSLQIKLLRDLRARKWDLAIDLFGNPRSALLTFLSGARMRIGGDFRGRRMYYTHRVRDGGTPKSAIQFHLNYLQPLGLHAGEKNTFIHVTDVENTRAKAFLQERGYDLQKPIVGLHSGATWPAKKWFADRFAQLAQRLHNQAGVQVFLTTGPGEEELCRRVRQWSGLDLNEPAVLPLRPLAALIRQFNVFVCNDCGPLHLGPALGTPTVGIFGPSEPNIWFPYEAKRGHRLVYHELDCSHCHRDFCDTMDCMKAISTAQVYDHVCSALGRT